MLTLLRGKRLLVPTVSTLFGLAVLVWLGSWQMQRRAWKETLIANIETRTKAPPTTLEEALQQWQRTGEAEYLRVRFSGRPMSGREAYLYAPMSGGPGWHVYTPVLVDLAGAGGERTPAVVIVNRGLIPDALKPPLEAPVAGRAEQPSTQRDGDPIEIIGLVRRAGSESWFTPANDAHRNVWHWRDLDGMVARLQQSDTGTGGPRLPALPFFVDAEAVPVNPGGWPRGGTTRLEIPNRHLEYALTWYGLALTLLGVYLAFARSRFEK